MSVSSDTHLLFKELDQHAQNEEFTAAIKVCDKILKIVPDEIDALHYKVLCFVNLKKFNEALQNIDLAQKQLKDKKAFLFEKAYVEYATQNLESSLNTLSSLGEKSCRSYELEAQLNYRLENYEKCIEIYQKIVKEFKLDTPELYTNMAAAYNLAGKKYRDATEKFFQQKSKVKDQAFEFAYNVGTYFVHIGELDKAEQYLETAEKVCKKILEDECTEEEIQDELAVIQVQLAYIYQMRGEGDKSISSYTHVQSFKPSDIVVDGIATNNIISVKKNHDLFDALKKLNHLLDLPDFNTKFSAAQKRIISYNRWITLFYMSKYTECLEDISALKNQFSEESYQYIYYYSTLLQKLGNVDEAITTLNSYKTFCEKNNKEDDIYLQILEETAQLNMKQEKYKEAHQDFTKIYDKNANLTALAGMVFSATFFDRELASKLREKLPNLDMEGIRRLEKKNKEEQYKEKRALRNLRQASASGISVDQLDSAKKKQKPKKKKKRHLPENYDPNFIPDPDRWLPLRERSTYKPKRRKERERNLARGPQGSATKEAESQFDITQSGKTIPKQNTQPKQVPVQTPKANATSSSQPKAATPKKTKKGAKPKKKRR